MGEQNLARRPHRAGQALRRARAPSSRVTLKFQSLSDFDARRRRRNRCPSSSSCSSSARRSRRSRARSATCRRSASKIQKLLGDAGARKKLWPSWLGGSTRRARVSKDRMATEQHRAPGGATHGRARAPCSTRSSPRRRSRPSDEGYDVAKRGVQAFIAELLTPKREGEKVDKALRRRDDRRDRRQAVARRSTRSCTTRRSRSSSRAWRGLKFLVDRVDFRENIKVELLNCSQGRPARRLRGRARGRRSSGLYKHRLLGRVRQFGGKPVRR